MELFAYSKLENCRCRLTANWTLLSILAVKSGERRKK